MGLRKCSILLKRSAGEVKEEDIRTNKNVKTAITQHKVLKSMQNLRTVLACSNKVLHPGKKNGYKTGSREQQTTHPEDIREVEKISDQVEDKLHFQNETGRNESTTYTRQKLNAT